jgi:hypothetical protein
MAHLPPGSNLLEQGHVANKVPRRRNARRLAGTAGCLGAAAAIAAHAASASFTGSASQAQTGGSPASSAGTLYLTVPAYSAGPGSNGTAVANRLQLAVDDLYPNANLGRERVIDMTNAGSLKFASVTMQVSVTSSSSPNGGNIYSDTNGVKVLVQTCPTDWVEAGSSPDYTYTCAGNAQTDVLGTSGAYSTFQNFAQAGSACLTGCTINFTSGQLAAGAVNHLHFVFKVGASAAANSQGSSFQTTITFNGTQRAGQNM